MWIYDLESERPELKEIVTAVEQNPNHVWHKLLGDLTCNTFKPSF